MASQKLRKCGICKALNLQEDKYCHYCGYLLEWKTLLEDERYVLYCAEDNVGQEKNTGLFNKVSIRVSNVLVKRHSAFDRAKALKQKIVSITTMLQSVVSKESTDRISEFIGKMQSLYESLVSIRTRLEFQKCIGNLAAVREAYDTKNVEEIQHLLTMEKSSFIEWKDDLLKTFPFPSIEESVATCLDEFGMMTEQIALAIISNILSTTSLLSSGVAEELSARSKDIDEETERINYELDRLQGEFSLM